MAKQEEERAGVPDGISDTLTSHGLSTAELIIAQAK